ncbi:MAG: hypothetical protein HYR91_05710 [Flavobacteriia bacterium]|nr:hypothetical protein [Flavobacteriia bacterium]
MNTFSTHSLDISKEAMKLITISLMFVLCYSCGNKCFKKGDCANNQIKVEGKFLVDNVFFPQDTLRLNFYKESDSTKTKKLMLELKNDSIYLSNYKNQHLKINAHYQNTFVCENKYVTQKIIYKLLNYTDSSYVLLKIIDTSDCQFSKNDLVR